VIAVVGLLADEVFGCPLERNDLRFHGTAEFQ
jgi:hypothetical protein